MKTRTILLLGLVLLCVERTNAHVYFQDGEYHLINYDVNDWVMIDTYTSPIPGTHLEVVSGGKLPLVELLHYGKLTVNGGIVNYVNANHNSEVEIHNGIITMDGQYGSPRFIINNDSRVNIYGGLFETFNQQEGIPSFDSTDTSKINIRGGYFESGIDFCAQDSSTITIYGTDFNYPYGEITAQNGIYENITISGTLTDGNLINHSFILDGPDSTIVLVPEPCTLALLAIGGLALHKRRDN